MQVDKNVVVIVGIVIIAVIVAMEIAIAMVYYFCLKRIFDKGYDKSEKKFDVEYGMLCREVQSEVIRTSPFEKNGKVTDFDWYDSGLKDFRERDIERDKTDKRMLQKKRMTIQSLIDLCEMQKPNIAENAAVIGISIAILTMVLTVSKELFSLLNGDQSWGIVYISLFFLLIIFLLVALFFLYKYTVKKVRITSEALKKRKMLLMGVCREIETRISELEEERKQKELEEAKKRREQEVCEDKVLKSTTQIKILEKEILRIDSEKGFKKIDWM